MPKIYEFYEINSKIFANYIILSESRYIYKNIQKKQKLIDELQEIEIENEKKNMLLDDPFKDRVLNTEECNSIMNQTQSVRNLNIKSTKNNSMNNSLNSIELLVDKIEKADFLRFNKKNIDKFIQIKDNFEQKNNFDNKSLLNNTNKKKLLKDKQYPSFDYKILEIFKRKEKFKKKFFLFNEKTNSQNKTPDKLRLIENANNDNFTNRDKNLVKRNLTDNKNNFLSNNIINTTESKSNVKSRNKLNFQNSKSIPKTIDIEILKQNKDKTNDKLAFTMQKKQSELSIPKLSYANTILHNIKFPSKPTKSNSRQRNMSTKRINDTNDIQPLRIMINLDNIELKKAVKQAPLSSKKYTRNLRNNVINEEQNNSNNFKVNLTNFQTLNSHNQLKIFNSRNDSNRFLIDKLSSLISKQTIETSQNVKLNPQSHIIEDPKSRNGVKKQDSLKVNYLIIQNKQFNLFQSITKLAQNNSSNSRNLVLINSNTNKTNEKKNMTPDFNKISKVKVSSKSPLKKDENYKILNFTKINTEKQPFSNRKVTDKGSKMHYIFESALLSSVPNSARIESFIEKNKK